MSTSPYSKDLRTKVVNYLEKGGSQKEAAIIFSLHRNTISRWWCRYQKEGVIEARERLGAKRKLDLEKLGLFVENNHDCNLAEIGKHFKITRAWASICLRKIGYSYKKKSLPTWKRAKRKESNT